jgi:predicted phosphate transport protein (TIGR00153 family)
MPQEPKFFPMLNSLAAVIGKASGLLKECIDKKLNEEDVESFYKLIKEEERNGDRITTDIFNQLSLTFITPFDREDIHDLANSLDDIIDAINSAAKRIWLYNPKGLPNESKDLANIIEKGVARIQDSINELHNLKKDPKHISQCCDALHDLENDADDLYAQFIKRIFSEEGNAVELIKVKDIMHELEKTTDCAEHVAKILKTIIVKNA